MSAYHAIARLAWQEEKSLDARSVRVNARTHCANVTRFFWLTESSEPLSLLLTRRGRDRAREAKMTTDLAVANEIKRQLGGRRFELMTGARDFLGDVDLLRFSLPRAKNGINKVEVRLDPSDTYTVTAWRVVRPTARNGFTYQAQEKAKVSDVYCDNLRDVFTEITGLATSL